MIRALAVLALFALGAPLSAAQEPEFDPSDAVACLDQGAQHACFGVAARACAGRFGPTTPVIETCLQAEYQYWDGLLGHAVAAARDTAVQIDAKNRLSAPDAPSRAQALDKALDAWRAFKGHQCGFVAASWWGGTGAGAAELRCKLELTGSYALQLKPDIWKMTD